MAFTFDINLGDAVSRIRFDLGDTDESAPFLQDETITAMLAAQGADESKTTVALANALIAQNSHKPSKVALPDEMGTIEWKDRLAGWQELVTRVNAAAVATSSGFRVLRPKRDEDRSEYRADGRCPW